jgi:LysR family transcriptional regulator, transcriptional activator of nhaA
MEWLNYHHLLYFWVVGREGSVTAAARELRLAPPTISGQIRHLEQALGEKLFLQKGRRLVLTDVGRVAYRYADEIFSLGREFLDTVKGLPTGRQLRVVVGVSDVIAKSIVHRILEPAFGLDPSVWVVCREHRSTEAFMGELAMNTVDVILSDAPAGPGAPVRTFNHLLGECGTSFFAAPALARAARRKFPRSLDGAPVLLPGSDSTFRRALNSWFEVRNLRPIVRAELDDAALAAVLGEAGIGIFAAPDVIASELRKRYAVELVGRAEDIPQRFYAISLERKLKNPAVVAISQLARTKIFA